MTLNLLNFHYYYQAIEKKNLEGVLLILIKHQILPSRKVFFDIFASEVHELVDEIS